MKRIWIINHYAEPPTDGKYTRHYHFGEELIKRGYEVNIFTASTVHGTDTNFINDGSSFLEKKINKVPFIFVRASNYKGNGTDRIKNMLQYSTRILKVSKNFTKPDIIYASSPHPLTWLAGYKLSKRYGAKFIVETRDLWPESFVAYNLIKKNSPLLKIMYAGERWIYKNADKIIFTMEGGKDYITDKGWDKNNGGPIDLNKVYHINNGVDLNEFEFNKRNYILDDEDLKDDSFYKIVYTGSLRQANDSVWKLIEVADLFKKKEHFDIKFLIYGDGGERKKIEEYCKENKLDNVCIKGYVDKKYVPYILSRCDLNILNCSSRSVLKYGGSQNKLFEYLASGHPIISGESSKYSIISNYNCGTSRNFEDIDSLGEAILELKNLDSNSKKIMSENILTVAKNYDYAYLTQKLIEIIEG